MNKTPHTPTEPLILVVDDNDTNRDLLARRLGRQNFTTLSASGGHEALDVIATQPIDLVLLDINMPDLDGVSVLRQVRADRDQTDLPIIMVSAHDESEQIAEAITAGANDYITKPVDMPVALARINAQLAVRFTHAELKESEERYSLAFRGANDGLWDWDLRTGEIFYSERWKEMLGLTAADIGSTPEDWFNLVHPDELEGLKAAINDHLEGRSEALEHEYRALHKDGAFRWLLTRGVASKGENGQAVRISGSQTDVTKSKAYDPITSIPNTLLFMDRLEWLVDKEKRNPNSCFAVLLVKVDRLRELRQTLGPVAGEEILVQTARRLTESLRDGDTLTNLQGPDGFTISRHDDADFAVLVESCKDETTAPKMAERLQNVVREPLTIGGEEIVLTTSLGIVMGGGAESLSAEELIQHATNALARAMSKGPGNYELFDRDMQDRAVARLKLETDLRRAIAAGELSLHFQPIVEISTGMVSGCEALARWKHPELGNIGPDVFIPLAEECGLIDAIGDWVLEEACLQHRTWVEDGYGPIDLSVNLSVLQMQRDGVADRILEILERTQMDPKRLKLEITESIFMEDMERVGKVLSALTEHGIGIAIDDFGTGYSSLAYLNRLPITHLKIDRSFISDVSNDIASQAIVQSTLLMAQSLGIKVVAEGIEAPDQVALLQVLKAEYGQGFHFWRPMESDAFSQLLLTLSKKHA